MGNVVMAYIVEEESAHPSEERPVDGSSSATKEGPFTLPVVGDGGVGVMQEGEHDDPVVHELEGNQLSARVEQWEIKQAYQVRNEVVVEEEFFTQIIKNQGHGANTKIRHEDWEACKSNSV